MGSQSHALAALSPRKQPLNTLKRRTGWPRSRSGRGEGKKQSRFPCRELGI